MSKFFLLLISITLTTICSSQDRIIKNLIFDSTENNVLYVGIVNKLKFSKNGEYLEKVTSSNGKINLRSDTILLIVNKVGRIRLGIKTNKEKYEVFFESKVLSPEKILWLKNNL